MTQINNHYPNDITNQEFEKRCIRLLVKHQPSFAGDLTELQQNLLKKYNDIKEIYNNKGLDNSSPSNKERQSQIRTRMEKLFKGKTVYGVALPLPNELSESQNHQWSTTEGAVSNISKKVTEREILGVSVNKLISEIASSSGSRKPMIDPGYFQDYNGTEPRQFTFSWDLIPNNSNDVEQIKTILYHLKKYTLPTSAVSGIGLLSPFSFDIEIGSETIQDLMNINNVVCTAMTIDYGADGGLQFLADGMPKFIKLSMSFVERGTITADMY